MPISFLARCCARAVFAIFSLILGSKLGAVPLHPEPDWNPGGELHINRSIDSSQNISLQRPLTLNIDQGHTVRLRGLITSPLPGGLETLNKDGAGRLELWGENKDVKKYVRLRAGTLHVAGRYALGSDAWAQLRIHPGTTLSYEAGAVVAANLILENTLTHVPEAGQDPAAIHWRVDHGMATQIGAIHNSSAMQNSPTMVKVGAGTLWLRDGNTSPLSGLTVAEGAVQLDSRFAGAVNVQNGARLTGNGQTGTLTVAPGGILAPTGRMTADRALQLHANSQLHIRAWADGQHDRIHVLDGGAQLDGHVIALPQGPASAWQQTVEAVIVHARDGLGGSRFASVESALPYLETELRYDENDVILLLRPRKQTPGQSTQPKGLSSGWAASVRNMLVDDSRFIRDAVFNQVGRHRHAADDNRNTYKNHKGHNSHNGHKGHNAPYSDRPFKVNHHVWTQAFHSSGVHRGSSTTGDGLDRRISGLLMGAEQEISPAWRLGVYGGGTRTHANRPSTHVGHHGIRRAGAGADAGLGTGTGGTAYDSSASGPSANVDSAHLGVYAHHDTAWGGQLTAGIAHSWHHLRSHRTAVTSVFSDHLSSRYRARTGQVFTQILHPIWASEDQHTTLTPFARLAWVHTRQGAHTEQGGALALHLPTDRASVLFSTLGLRAEQYLQLPQGNATLSGSLSWRHAGGDTRSPVQQHFRDDIFQHRLTASGISVPRHAWNLQLGIQADLSKRAQLGLHYAGQYAKRLQDHGVQVGVVMRW